MKKSSLIAIVGSLAASAVLIVSDYMGYQKGIDDVRKKHRAIVLNAMLENIKKEND